MRHEQIGLKKETPATQASHFKPGPVLNGGIPQSSQMQHHRNLGNRAVQRMLETRAVQAKLTIGQPNDIYEQEADRVADQVMRMPEPKGSLVNGQWSLVQRKSSCPECQEDEELIQTKPLAEQITPLVQRQEDKEIEEETAQLKALPNKAPSVTSGLQHRIQSLEDGGQPLPAESRAFYESRFGADFSQVRMHTDSIAAETAKSVNAKAFTIGKDVVFGAGQYSPGTSTGKTLLAHELTHVVQQGEGNSIQRNVVAPAQQSLVLLSGASRQPMSALVQRQDDKAREALLLVEQRSEFHRLVANWYTRYVLNLETNARNARAANQRFIEFEEGGISKLRTAGSVGSGVAYLFGTPGAVVALCVIVLTEVAAQKLSSRTSKIAAAVANLDNRLTSARNEVAQRKKMLDDRISMTETLDWSEWTIIGRAIYQVRVPEVVPENFIYRDLLLAFARGGGYNISGSQWNVKNMSIFGDAPWYHSWDFGSPGWTNGQDIAAELNALAEGDPSTRTRVSINPP